MKWLFKGIRAKCVNLSNVKSLYTRDKAERLGFLGANHNEKRKIIFAVGV